MANNTTYGVQRIRDANLSGVNQSYNGTTLSEFESRFGELFTESLAGSYEMSGMLLLALVGFGLYQRDVSLDVSATVIIPLLSILASGGFLPAGEGIIFGMLIAIAGIGVFGVLKFISR
jgi:hypothetical protein